MANTDAANERVSRLLIHLQPVERGAQIPIDNYPLAAAIYGMLAKVAPDYAEFLHDEGYAADGPDQSATVRKHFKFFVFSRLAQQGKRIANDRICLSDSLITWQVGSPLEEQMAALAQSLLTMPGIVIGDRESHAALAIAGVEVQPPPDFTTQWRGETIAPIFVPVSVKNAQGETTKHHVRADVEAARFAQGIAANLREKYRALTGEEPPDTPLDFKFTEKPRSQLVQYKGTDHKAWMGRFILRGDEQMLRLAWEAGLGAANSKGFGMFRVL